MLNHFGCGTFHDEDIDHELCLASPNSSPKKSKKRDKNPYSTRGLDKFSELLADLDEKRQRIYSQMNPHDISFVRFVHSSTNDFVPVVVKVKNKDTRNNKSHEIKVLKAKKHFIGPNLEPIEKSKSESNEIVEEEKQDNLVEIVLQTKEHKKKNKKRKNRFIMIFNNWSNLMKKPCFYVPMVMILILILLTFFGRTFATLCTCILWYIIPTFNDTSSSNLRKSMMKKKDYVRGVSEKKMVVVNNNKKKDYVRWMSENKIVVNKNDEEMMNSNNKKKDYVRGWSEKKIETDGLFSDEANNSENFKPSGGKHGHKKSW